MAHRRREDVLKDREQYVGMIGRRYQHYKTKGIYVVEDIVMLEASGECAVLYRDEAHPQLAWVRSCDDFLAVVDDGPRFKLLD